MGRRKPKQLSGGQQQRIALARALVKRPEVLLLDEPLGALDLKLRKEMQLELKALQEQVGITFIYVTHDQEEALTMSNRIAVMSRGKHCRSAHRLRFMNDQTVNLWQILSERQISLSGTVKEIDKDRVVVDLNRTGTGDLWDWNWRLECWSICRSLNST